MTQQNRITRPAATSVQTCTLVSGFVLIVCTAIVHGLWTDRWNDGHDLEQAVVRLQQVPLAIDGWNGNKLDLDEESVRRAGMAGYLRGAFSNAEIGQPVSVVLMCGRFGPMSVHTPDVCYGGAGYEMHGSPVRVRVAVQGSQAEFWSAQFQKPHDPSAPPLRLFWSWSSGNGWEAPDNPRWTFRRQPVLFKLYVARAMITLDEELDADACLAFLRVWLPHVDGILFD